MKEVIDLSCILTKISDSSFEKSLSFLNFK